MAPYFIRNLVPRREARNANRRPLLEVLRTVTWVQWAQFLSGCVSCSFVALSRRKSKCGVCLWRRWLAWTCDAIDFFSVSLSVPLLQKQFNKDKASTIVRFPLLARSPFVPCPRMNCLYSCFVTQTQAITLTLLFRSFGAVSASSSHVPAVMLHVQCPALYALAPLPIAIQATLWAALLTEETSLFLSDAHV